MLKKISSNALQLFLVASFFVVALTQIDEALYNVKSARLALEQAKNEPSAPKRIDFEKMIEDLKKIETELKTIHNVSN